MGRGQLLQLADDALVQAEPELRVDAFLEGGQPLLVEPRRLDLRSRLVAEVLERVAAPEREGFAQERGAFRRIGSEPSAGDEAFEAAAVELVGADLEDVAGPARRQPLATELLAQLRDVDVYGRCGSRRRTFPPQRVDEALDRDRTVRVDEQRGEQCALATAAERQRAAVVANLEGA